MVSGSVVSVSSVLVICPISLSDESSLSISLPLTTSHWHSSASRRGLNTEFDVLSRSTHPTISSCRSFSGSMTGIVQFHGHGQLLES